MRKMGLLLISDYSCARGRPVGHAYFHVRVDGNRVRAIAPWAHYIAYDCSAFRFRRIP